MPNTAISTPLFHGSRFYFESGFKLLPQPDGYVQGEGVSDFEALVEARRPAHKLSRSKSVFLSTDMDLIDGAGGYIDAIYQVAPTNPPESSDLAWYSEAWCEFSAVPCDHAKVAELIECYWSGVPFHDLTASNIEFRAEAAIVIGMQELNVQLEELRQVTAASASSTHNQQIKPDEAFSLLGH